MFLALLWLGTPVLSQAQELLPHEVIEQAKMPLEPVGTGKYRKLGFTIYQATLWAPEGMLDASKPYALQLRYALSLSQETLYDAVAEGIREQDPADNVTIMRWEETLKKTLPAVEEDDEIIGLAIPGRDSQLFYNGAQIAQITEPAFSQAFFGIWLGDHADESLREKLLGEQVGQIGAWGETGGRLAITVE